MNAFDNSRAGNIGSNLSGDYRWKSPIGAVDRAIARLAERQHGVVARRQLRSIGLADSEIDYASGPVG